MILLTMFHWSPISNRKGIVRHGLRPGRPPKCYDWSDLDVADDYKADHICLTSSPEGSWLLSGDVFGQPGEEWDLWQVTLDVEDELVPMPMTGPELGEVRVLNRIPKRRVWYVATRIVP